MTLHIFCDGGSRANPGPAASAFIVYESGGNNEGNLREIYKSGTYLGVATNNVAEYKAVILALDWLIGHLSSLSHLSDLYFFLDSNLVVSQINGVYKVKDPTLSKLFTEVKNLLSKIEPEIKVNFSHIYREKNSKADKLVNETLDNLSSPTIPSTNQKSSGHKPI